MRRFLIQSKDRPDQILGQGVVWDAGVVSLHFDNRLPSGEVIGGQIDHHKSLDFVVNELKLSLYWIDPVWDGPQPCHRSTNGGPYVQTTQYSSNRLHDGWGSPNGVCDKNGTPLHTGQRVRLINYRTNPACYGEALTDIGEITALTVNERGRLRVTLAGVNVCNMADVDLDEIEAVEITTRQTYERYGRKPLCGWTPTVTIGKEPV